MGCLHKAHVMVQRTTITGLASVSLDMQDIKGVPTARLCSSIKAGRSEHLDMPQLPLLMGALMPVPSAQASGREKESSQQQ